MTKKNALYAQSGGVTAVINASACGVIETARAHRDKIGKVYAGRNGIIGALTEDLIDTGKESASAIAALRSTPSGAFGSCRYKLKSLETHRREYERLIEVFRAHNIGTFCLGNPAGFHRDDGAGYAVWAERVLEIDAFNPQLASRIARALDRWTQLAEPYRGAARAAIARVATAPKLSSDTGEIVSRALSAG